ncbi:MAG: alpha/beta fold hydrolase [Alphaproteobacteria bacterium]
MAENGGMQAAEKRQGPRPLPLHLMTATLAWSSSLAALPLARSGSPIWSPSLRSAGEGLARELAAVPTDDVAAALVAEIAERSNRLLRGIEAYRHHPARRLPSPVRIVWQNGAARLLDLGPADGVPLLVVPSLINRWHILDLMPGHSFLATLVAEGVRPLVLDWGTPGAAERDFSLTDHVAGRLDAALSAARVEAGGRAVAVLGYCMGGMLALALALRRQDEVPALALVAAPWDFHAAGPQDRNRAETALGLFEPVLAAAGELPIDAVQYLFQSLDPLQVVEKFLRFAELDPATPRAALFVAVEDWANDGVPLAAAVARECLGGWYVQNEPARGLWRVAGRPVLPADWRKPALVVVPSRDRIVPPASAAALALALPQGERMDTPGGHIGMMVGEAAAPVARRLGGWLRALAA